MKGYFRITIWCFCTLGIIISQGFGQIPRGSNSPLSPIPEQVVGIETEKKISLDGDWKFKAPAPEGFMSFVSDNIKDFKNIKVPGEWVMQGFNVPEGKAAAYWREFEIPQSWNGHRIKLRLDGVYSDAVVAINGEEVGRHIGGFTPFELDVTAKVKPGKKNIITLGVRNDSLADSLSNGSTYACHALGGITRDIQLFALPNINLSKCHVTTTFDKEFNNAKLQLDLELSKESGAELSGLDAVITLDSPDGHPIFLKLDRVALKNLKTHLIIPIVSPQKWDNEHPNLYKLTVRLVKSEQILESLTQRIGFRQVEVRGNQMFLNNVPIKLHGVCRHEVHPLRGRSPIPELCRQDVELFRDGNCNFIRTSHYPPSLDFIKACDELGMLVEVEAPFCWADRTHLNASQIPECVISQELEMVEAYRDHPSVTHWSLANESEKAWKDYFLPAAKAVKSEDPSRPINYSSIHYGMDEGYCDIGNHHYPGLNYPDFSGPEKYATNTRPVTFDEYCHLNSYNRRELATDPGLRDMWGAGLECMWDKMRQSQGCLGGAIWAGIDDTFFLPNGETVGYGTWGPIDGWRRPKPEFWHMKKAYSPLRIRETLVPSTEKTRLVVENRHDFTDLSEVVFEWHLGEKSGEVTTSARPGETGILEIPINGNSGLLKIKAKSPRGFNLDEWEIAVGDHDPRVALPKPLGMPGQVTMEKTEKKIVIHGQGYTITINPKTGMITAPFTGPELMLLPKNADNCGGVQMKGKETEVPLFSDTCHDWRLSLMTAESITNGVVVYVEGVYKEAKGAYTYIFSNDGVILIRYSFLVTELGKCDPRQIGLVFSLPEEFGTLSWRRHGLWSFYPKDHIARSQGVAKAFYEGVPLCSLTGPRSEPCWGWNQEGSRFGSNDFRSTKKHIYEAELYSRSGRSVRFMSDGSQDVRCWIEKDRVKLLCADYTNEGAGLYFSEHVVPNRPIKKGDFVNGTTRLEIH